MSGHLLEKQFDCVIKSFRLAAKSKSSKSDSEEGTESSSTKRIRISSEAAAMVQLNSDPNFRLKIEHSPTIENFSSNYFQTGTPLIIDGQMKHWPASSKWRCQN